MRRVTNDNVSESDGSSSLAVFVFVSKELANKVDEIFSVLKRFISSEFSDAADTSGLLLDVTYRLSHVLEVGNS